MWVQRKIVGVRSDRAVGTRVKKEEFIKVRVSKEQKELFKRVAEIKGITMTELLVVGTENFARQQEENIKVKDMINVRAMRTEENIQELKIRMEQRKKEKNKFFFK